ncbi:Tm-1-like ATP-binding domain-containing protein [Parapedobacter pyrenivorans]|uniref:Tm-1-like ATP-binding domain-containing protein n=1 Tax=Parapedobacter pyrenivorans TaxID=1305674 RepID=UPI00333F4262
MSGDKTTGLINSGIQYRSNIVDRNKVGYQADIGDGYWRDDNRDVTLMRIDEHENRKLGRILADKLALSSAPVSILLPIKGLP